MWLLLLKKGAEPEDIALWTNCTKAAWPVQFITSEEAWARSQPFTEGNFQAYINWCVNAMNPEGTAPLFAGLLVPEGSIGMGTKTLIERFQAAGRPVGLVRVGQGMAYLDRVEKTTGKPADGWVVR
jgi:hypothetical protein